MATEPYDLSPSLSYELLEKVNAEVIRFDSRVHGAPSFSGKALQISPCVAATVSHWFNPRLPADTRFDIRYGNGISFGSAQLVYKDISSATEFALLATPRFIGELPVSMQHLGDATKFPLEIYLHGYNADETEVFAKITIVHQSEWNRVAPTGAISFRTDADPNGSSGTPVTDKLGNIYGLHLGDGKIASFNSLVPALEFAIAFAIEKYLTIGKMNQSSEIVEILDKTRTNYLMWAWAHDQLTRRASASCDRLDSDTDILADFVYRFREKKSLSRLVRLVMDNIEIDLK